MFKWWPETGILLNNISIFGILRIFSLQPTKLVRMRTSAQPPVHERSLVDLVAKHIPDPVVRLRFLKAATPALPSQDRNWPSVFKRSWLRVVLGVAAVTVLCLPFLLFSRLRASARVHASPVPPAVRKVALAPIPDFRSASDVWLVEKSGESETYSNGLRINNRFLVHTHERSYLAFPVNGSQPVRRTVPAGIVFHTTESQQAPFQASANRVLQRLGESLLEYVKRQHAYNFVIDRFGRVYRAVAENETANHAGYSTWADDSWLFINLNESFIGISFEAASPTGQHEAEISPAQARSAATLIEMLRKRYQIPAANCVTHAQVSVNPDNMRVGLHVDWASGFPFLAMGLPDNYASALPALWAYGFDYDPQFARLGGTRMRAGIDGAEAILARSAAAAGLGPGAYKQTLRRRYREMLPKVQRARQDGGLD